MLKIFTFFALFFLVVNANENPQINCDDIYEKCIVTCEEKSPNDSSCFEKCQIIFDDCISNEEKLEDNSFEDNISKESD